MTALLLLVGVAGAVPWWAADPPAAEALRAALVQGWPAGPFVVRVGTPDGLGAWYADGTLHVVLPDATFVGPVGPEPLEQVVVARAWVREAEVSVRAPGRPAPVRPHVGAMAGTGLGRGAAPGHLAVEAGARWRQVAFGAALDADLGAVHRADDQRPVREQRVGLGAQAGAQVPLWGGELRVVAGPAARWVVAAVPEAGATAAVLAGVGERVQWWRTVGPGWAFGVGSTVRLDGAGGSWRATSAAVADTRYARPELTAALEVGFAWIGEGG